MSTTASNTNLLTSIYGSWRWGSLKLFKNSCHGGSHNTRLLIYCMNSIPPGIESDFDSEGDIIFLNDLLNDDPIAEYEHFTSDIEPDTAMIKNFNELNEDKCFDLGGGEIVFSPNVEDDDSFTFFIRTFLPFLTYPEDYPLLLSTGSEDIIFDPGIST
ncbi:hypothetical protein Tco_0097289 [Tanacetum coccineum]